MYCSKCGKQIPDESVFCPGCGATQMMGKTSSNNRRVKKKPPIIVRILVIVGAIFVGVTISSILFPDVFDGGEQRKPITEAKEPESRKGSEPEGSAISFADGTYMVNSDIAPGLYRVKVTEDILGMGYIERSSDLSMELSSIIANIVLTGDGYAEIKDSDVAVKLQGVEVWPIDLSTYAPGYVEFPDDGMYLVGYDIAPGRYKVEITDAITEMAYVERLNSASYDFDAIISNDIFQGQGYVDISETDFAVRIQGGRLMPQ